MLCVVLVAWVATLVHAHSPVLEDTAVEFASPRAVDAPSSTLARFSEVQPASIVDRFPCSRESFTALKRASVDACGDKFSEACRTARTNRKEWREACQKKCTDAWTLAKKAIALAKQQCVENAAGDAQKLKQCNAENAPKFTEWRTKAKQVCAFRPSHSDVMKEKEKNHHKVKTACRRAQHNFWKARDESSKVCKAAIDEKERSGCWRKHKEHVAKWRADVEAICKKVAESAKSLACSKRRAATIERRAFKLKQCKNIMDDAKRDGCKLEVEAKFRKWKAQDATACAKKSLLSKACHEAFLKFNRRVRKSQNLCKSITDKDKRKECWKKHTNSVTMWKFQRQETCKQKAKTVLDYKLEKFQKRCQSYKRQINKRKCMSEYVIYRAKLLHARRLRKFKRECKKKKIEVLKERCMVEYHVLKERLRKKRVRLAAEEKCRLIGNKVNRRSCWKAFHLQFQPSNSKDDEWKVAQAKRDAEKVAEAKALCASMTKDSMAQRRCNVSVKLLEHRLKRKERIALERMKCQQEKGVAADKCWAAFKKFKIAEKKAAEVTRRMIRCEVHRNKTYREVCLGRAKRFRDKMVEKETKNEKKEPKVVVKSHKASEDDSDQEKVCQDAKDEARRQVEKLRGECSTLSGKEQAECQNELKELRAKLQQKIAKACGIQQRVVKASAKVRSVCRRKVLVGSKVARDLKACKILGGELQSKCLDRVKKSPEYAAFREQLKQCDFVKTLVNPLEAKYRVTLPMLKRAFETCKALKAAFKSKYGAAIKACGKSNPCVKNVQKQAQGWIKPVRTGCGASFALRALRKVNLALQQARRKCQSSGADVCPIVTRLELIRRVQYLRYRCLFGAGKRQKVCQRYKKASAELARRRECWKQKAVLAQRIRAATVACNRLPVAGRASCLKTLESNKQSWISKVRKVCPNMSSTSKEAILDQLEREQEAQLKGLSNVVVEVAALKKAIATAKGDHKAKLEKILEKLELWMKTMKRPSLKSLLKNSKEAAQAHDAELERRRDLRRKQVLHKFRAARQVCQVAKASFKSRVASARSVCSAQTTSQLKESCFKKLKQVVRPFFKQYQSRCNLFFQMQALMKHTRYTRKFRQSCQKANLSAKQLCVRIQNRNQRKQCEVDVRRRLCRRFRIAAKAGRILMLKYRCSFWRDPVSKAYMCYRLSLYEQSVSRRRKCQRLKRKRAVLIKANSAKCKGKTGAEQVVCVSFGKKAEELMNAGVKSACTVRPSRCSQHKRAIRRYAVARLQACNAVTDVSKKARCTRRAQATIRMRQRYTARLCKRIRKERRYRAKMLSAYRSCRRNRTCSRRLRKKISSFYQRLCVGATHPAAKAFLCRAAKELQVKVVVKSGLTLEKATELYLAAALKWHHRDRLCVGKRSASCKATLQNQLSVARAVYRKAERNQMEHLDISTNIRFARAHLRKAKSAWERRGIVCARKKMSLTLCFAMLNKRMLAAKSRLVNALQMRPPKMLSVSAAFRFLRAQQLAWKSRFRICWNTRFNEDKCFSFLKGRLQMAHSWYVYARDVAKHFEISQDTAKQLVVAAKIAYSNRVRLCLAAEGSTSKCELFLKRQLDAARVTLRAAKAAKTTAALNKVIGLPRLPKKNIVKKVLGPADWRDYQAAAVAWKHRYRICFKNRFSRKQCFKWLANRLATKRSTFKHLQSMRSCDVGINAAFQQFNRMRTAWRQHHHICSNEKYNKAKCIDWVRAHFVNARYQYSLCRKKFPTWEEPDTAGDHIDGTDMIKYMKMNSMLRREQRKNAALQAELGQWKAKALAMHQLNGEMGLKVQAYSADTGVKPIRPTAQCLRATLTVASADSDTVRAAAAKVVSQYCAPECKRAKKNFYVVKRAIKNSSKICVYGSPAQRRSCVEWVTQKGVAAAQTVTKFCGKSSDLVL